MLEPQTRAAFTEQLAPPPGFELVHAVGTTFTLDLVTAAAFVDNGLGEFSPWWIYRDRRASTG